MLPMINDHRPKFDPRLLVTPTDA
jgi:hypothetical protein